LDFGVVKVQIRWDLRPPVERLAVERQAPWQEVPLTSILDVSGRWRPLLGRRLLTYRFGLQDVESGQERWALLLAFEGGSKLLVALGELVEGCPTYLPDSLIVTADPDVALAYAPIASLGSVWSG
jgi:hypothetical protein